MTNNPKKIEMMEKQGIKVVERVPLGLAKARKTVPTLRPRRRNQATYYCTDMVLTPRGLRMGTASCPVLLDAAA